MNGNGAGVADTAGVIPVGAAVTRLVSGATWGPLHKEPMT